MSLPIHRLAALAAGCLLAGCSSHEAPLACAAARLVYDRDDRREPYQLGAAWAARGASQSVALVERKLAENMVAGVIDAADWRAESVLELCSDEPFAEQPAVASCSGVPISPDLILSAGHCVRSNDECRALVIARGLRNAAGAAWSGFTSGDLHRCRALIWSAGAEFLGTGQDLALVRIDPPLPDFVPPVLGAPLPPLGEQLVVLSHPLGLPLKLDDGAHLLGYEQDYWLADIDAFGGSSGGGVFSADGALLGVLVAGQPDFVYDVDARCNRSSVRAVRGCGAASFERVAPILPALQALCARRVDEACALIDAADETLTQR